MPCAPSPRAGHLPASRGDNSQHLPSISRFPPHQVFTTYPAGCLCHSHWTNGQRLANVHPGEGQGGAQWGPPPPRPGSRMGLSALSPERVSPHQPRARAGTLCRAWPCSVQILPGLCPGEDLENSHQHQRLAASSSIPEFPWRQRNLAAPWGGPASLLQVHALSGAPPLRCTPLRCTLSIFRRARSVLPSGAESVCGHSLLQCVRETPLIFPAVSAKHSQLSWPPPQARLRAPIC